MTANAAQSPPRESVPGRRVSVVVRLTLLMAAMLTVLLGALVTAGWFAGREVLRRQIDDRLEAVAASRRDFVREWIGRQQDRVDIFATRGVLRNFLERHVAGRSEEPQRTQSQENLDGIVQSGTALAACIVSREGRVLLSSEAAEVGTELGADPVFRAGLPAPAVGEPMRSGDRFIVRLAAPARWIDGTRGTIGVVMLTVDATSLAEALRDTTGLGQTGEVLLGVRANEMIRYLFPPRFRAETIELPASAVPALSAATEGRELLRHVVDYRGEPVIVAGCSIGHGGWGLVAKMDEKEAYAPIESARRVALLLALAVGVLGLVGAYSVARAFTRPIRRMAAAAQAVARGDLSVSVPVRSRDEVGALSSTFNDMTAALRARTLEREQADAALREGEERYRLLADHTEDIVMLNDTHGNRLYVSPSFVRKTGWTVEQLQSMDWRLRLHPNDVAMVESARSANLAGQATTIEHRIRCRDGSWLWVETNCKPVRDADGNVWRLLVWSHDITARKRAEEAMRASLEEKEVLLREVHHRVKNNLQVVSSLLNLQVRQLADPAMIAIFSSTRDRVRAMAAVHERLYESGDFAAIDLAAHLRALVRVLVRAHAPAGVNLQLAIETSPVTVDLNTAVPLSLIANELILNALKYAFAGRIVGRLTIELRAGGTHSELRIADDGPGLPTVMDPTTTQTLGMRLVRDLARQIGGELQFESAPTGTNVRLRWPVRSIPGTEPASPQI